MDHKKSLAVAVVLILGTISLIAYHGGGYHGGGHGHHGYNRGYGYGGYGYGRGAGIATGVGLGVGLGVAAAAASEPSYRDEADYDDDIEYDDDYYDDSADVYVNEESDGYDYDDSPRTVRKTNKRSPNRKNTAIKSKTTK